MGRSLKPGRPPPPQMDRHGVLPDGFAFMNSITERQRPKWILAILLLAACAWRQAASLRAAADQQPYGIDRRVPWTTSRVVGSPDPPLPCTVERTFTRSEAKPPIFITAEPDTDSLLVVQQGGEPERPSRILRVRDDPDSTRAEPLLVISNRRVYSVAFHPRYRTNGWLYVFSNGVTSQSDRTNRISRFLVDRQEPRPCDPLSKQIILQWHSQGHDGGGLVFGHDGMLYISTGDGTSDSDGWVTGQDLGELLGGVLRIDVDHTDGH